MAHAFVSRRGWAVNQPKDLAKVLTTSRDPARVHGGATGGKKVRSPI
jgi:hypothetical protein